MNFPLKVFPVDSEPYGKSYSEWSKEWWEWILKVPKPISPLFDKTGQNASIHQSDPSVYYLCQTREKCSQIPLREIRLPERKALFFPIINWISVKDIDGTTDLELAKVAREKMNLVSNLEITINEIKFTEKLDSFRVSSSAFVVSLPENNILDLPAGSTRVLSDGYWLLVQKNNLIKELSTFGSCSSGATRIGVRYLFR